MTILFVSDTYYPHVNGVYYFVRRLAALLQKKGHTVAVIIPDEKPKASVKIIDGIDVYGVPSVPVLLYPKVRYPNPFFLQSRIKKIIRFLKPDVIHIQDHFALANAVVKACRELEVPVIGTNHFMPENLTALLPFTGMDKYLEKWMWRSFTKVYDELALVTTPTLMAAKLIRPKLMVTVAPVSNGIDLDRFSARNNTSSTRNKYSIPHKPVLLYVGRLDPEKHIEDVLYAVEKAIKQTDFCFVIAGKGLNRKSLEQLAIKLGITGHIIFAGFVPDADLASFYNLASCFITASTAELQSIATMEAMASGLPVIAVDAGALGELVTDNENGFLFKKGNTSETANCITRIFSNKNLSIEMGRMSRIKIAKHDIHETIKQYESIYKRVKLANVIKMKVVAQAPDAYAETH